MSGAGESGRREFVIGGLALAGSLRVATARAQPMAGMEMQGAPQVPDAYVQPQLALAYRVFDALARLGEPISARAVEQVRALEACGSAAAAVRAALALLQPRVLLMAGVNPEARLMVSRARTAVEVVQGGWRVFLVRVDNPGLVPGRLGIDSPEALPVNGVYPPGSPQFGPMGPTVVANTTRGDMAARWLGLELDAAAPLAAELEAVPFDYKVISLYARDAGRRSAAFRLDLGSGSAALADHDLTTIDFTILPAATVHLSVRDHDGAPTTVSITIRDALGRVYPAQTKRALPDLVFQRHVYRETGQTLTLPPGDYTVETGRGPEYVRQIARRTVSATGANWDIRLQRWIDPGARGWYSGDSHVHAAGCAHYMQPEEGVSPAVLAPQAAGEGLAIASVLTWGPGFYTQKLNFTGRDNPVSTPATRLHYDLEVSGFPSSHCGHLVMLRMKGMDYPGTTKIEQWPSSNAPVLRWGRAQGAITGYAHSGLGLWAGTTDVPYDAIPPFDGIGANDFIVTLPEGLVDFMSICNQPPASELTIWYHTLNAGLRARIAGETDWPCIFEDSMGMGRSYVKLDGALTYEGWCAGLKAGRSYVSEGRAHLMDFAARAAGAATTVGGADLGLAAPEPVRFTVDVAALLAAEQTPATRALAKLAPMDKPYWHIERARIGDSRLVLAELIVNGYPVESRAVPADGTVRTLAFAHTPARSCWAAIRILGVAHTNPVWITVAGGPIHVKRSAQWCRKGVDQCWASKMPRIRAAERAEEARLYDRARAFYDRRIAEAGA